MKQRYKLNLIADIIIFVGLIINLLILFFAPMNWVNYITSAIIVNIWGITLALALILRNPYWEANRTITMDEWIDKYKDVRPNRDEKF